MGQDPGPEDNIIDLEDLTYESQLSFMYYRKCTDKWEGMSGMYLGKDLGLLPYYFELDEVDKPTVIYILRLIGHIDYIVSVDISEKQKATRNTK